VRSPRFGVRVAEYVVEDSILRKETVTFAIGAFISRVVERCQLIFHCGSFSVDFGPHKVIVSQSKDSRKFHDLDMELAAFDAEVDGGFIPISTSPSSGAELSYQFHIPVLI
jgi:hypothetical protein